MSIGLAGLGTVNRTREEQEMSVKVSSRQRCDALKSTKAGYRMPDLSAGVVTVVFSEDGSALLIGGRETQALCHFCGVAGELPQPSGVLIHSKPSKWALLHGGSPRQPKRFFICEKCAKAIVHSTQAD